MLYRKKEFCMKWKLKHCLVCASCGSSSHSECFTTHSSLPVSDFYPLDRGIARNPIQAVTASLLSTAAREHGAGRSTLHGSCRREQQAALTHPQEELAIQLLSSLQAWAALDMPGEIDKHLSDAFFWYVAAVGLQAFWGVSKQGWSSSESWIWPGNSRCWSKCFAGFTAFSWLGSFQWLWSKGLSLLHPHSLHKQRPHSKL